MEYRHLGGLKVSAIGLGTMTFGQQNTPAESMRNWITPSGAA
jgi:aryl-alcohol dehydrogenase-like predicted oxidoreductase